MISTDDKLFEQNVLDTIEIAFTNFKQEAAEFLLGRLPNGYIHGDDVISVYTRKGHHLISDAVIKCFDVGTIVVSEEYRNRGLGMRVINHMHSINPFRCTFVESIQNPDLYYRLKRYGWSDVPHSYPPSLFLMTPLPSN